MPVRPPSVVSVELAASVSPSEDPEKVLRAARGVLGDCDCRVESAAGSVRLLSRDAGCLQRLHDQLRDRRVRGAARRLLLRGREGNRFTLLLNRQAAFAGVAALCGSADESPLGPLVLSVESGDADALLEWLTAHGEPAG